MLSLHSTLLRGCLSSVFSFFLDLSWRSGTPFFETDQVHNFFRREDRGDK